MSVIPTNTDQCPYCGEKMSSDPSNADRLICQKCSKVFDKDDLEKMLLILQSAQDLPTGQRVERESKSSSNESREKNTKPERRERKPVDRSSNHNQGSKENEKRITKEDVIPMIEQFDNFMKQQRKEAPASSKKSGKQGFIGSDAERAISETAKVPMFLIDVAMSASSGNTEDVLKSGGKTLLHWFGVDNWLGLNESSSKHGGNRPNSNTARTSSKDKKPSGSSGRSESRGSSSGSNSSRPPSRNNDKRSRR